MQLVVMLVNKYEGPDIYTALQCEERGDVISVLPDSHVFSQKELDSPNYIIIQCDGTLEDYIGLKMREYGDYEANKMLRLRKRKIDLDEMMADGDGNIESESDCKKKLDAEGKPDKNKKRKKSKIVKTKAYVLSKVKIKPDVPDPAIVGETDLGVIG